MSVEEKIRRAEEIYNRRNGNNYTYKIKEKKKSSFVARMIKQTVMCFIIYGMFYVTTNREYLMSDDFQNKIQPIISKNENIEKSYNKMIEYIKKHWKTSEHEENNTVELVQEENNKQESTQNNSENIGGDIEKNVQIEEKTQEEKDIEEIKNSINFISPIYGRISSTFGWRNPTTESVPKYHTGLDIAAPTGTKIKAATDGKIILASAEGDYGKHYKIQINDIIIVYAHCSKLYLKEGDKVKQGEEIAEVGSTGNSTRTTFAF